MLNIKFDDEQIDIIFTKKPEEIMTITQFATDHCEKNIKAINSTIIALHKDRTYDYLGFSLKIGEIKQARRLFFII